MQAHIWADRSSRKNSINSILIGMLTGALLFGPGCQTDTAKMRAQTSIRSAQLSNGENNAIVWSRKKDLMVPLGDFESSRSMGNSSFGTLAATEGGSDLEKMSKWDTAMADLFGLPGVAWDDAKVVAKNPTNLVILGLAGGASIWGEFDFDNRVDEKLGGWKIINKDWTIAVGTSGSPATHFALSVALYTHGLLTENATTNDFAKTLTQALVLTGITTVGLKLAAWNHSPNGELFGWPSGHTSSTITVASVVHQYYGFWPAVPLYTLTGLVMYERMITGEHWASDVIFGAALGLVIGHSVASGRQPQFMGMDIVPYVDPYRGATGIGLVKTW